MMRLNDRQRELATSLRGLVTVPEGVAWGDFIDFTAALAAMLEGAETLTHPMKMQKRFQAAWSASAGLWNTEHKRILRDCLGGGEHGQKEFERVKAHPNGSDVLGRILTRVKETHGPLTTGMFVDVGTLRIGEILDELGPEEFDEIRPEEY